MVRGDVRLGSDLRPARQRSSFAKRPLRPAASRHRDVVALRYVLHEFLGKGQRLGFDSIDEKRAEKVVDFVLKHRRFDTFHNAIDQLAPKRTRRKVNT